MIYATTAITSVVFINGIDIVKQPRLAKDDWVVMQDDLLDTTLTVKEIIAHGILFDLTVKVAAEKAEQLLKFVGLSDYQNKATTSLSGGMRRRLVLARALIND